MFFEQLKKDFNTFVSDMEKIFQKIYNFIKPLTNFPPRPGSKTYDLDSLNGINSIPLDASSIMYNGYSTPMYYVLQRKATEHKQNGNMDLAIACLRKSNEISDTFDRIPLLEEDYLRLVKYLEKSGDFELAESEKEKIYHNHPEFLDKSITSARLIKETVERAKQQNQDLIILSASKNCPFCQNYNKQIYSISGRNSTYFMLPDNILNGGVCKDHVVSATIYFSNLNS